MEGLRCGPPTGEQTWDGYLLVATELPSAIISSNHGPALTNEELHAVARALSKLDHFLLLYCEAFYKRISAGELNQGDISAQKLALNDLDDIQTIMAQFEEIKKDDLSSVAYI